jgi:hypothetical protein
LIESERGTNCCQKINVQSGQEEAGKEMRENSSGKVLAGDRDLAVDPKNERRD